MKVRYFVRHGLCDNNTINDYILELNEKGISFSKKLPNLIPEEIEFIATSMNKRCTDTIKHIMCPIIKEFDNNAFRLSKPFEEAIKYNSSIICFCKEEISNVNEKLNFLKSENTDETYEFIYKIGFIDNKKN